MLFKLLLAVRGQVLFAVMLFHILNHTEAKMN